jgi:hypothetical protein
MREDLMSKMDKFKKEIENLSLPELQEIEKKVIEECEEIDKTIAETKFIMPEENYSEVASAVRYFLNKQSVQWQYTLGMVGMHDFWGETRADEIPYAHLDSILRTLGGMQFTGYEEWAKVIMINKYFEPLREAYSEVTEKAYEAATRHQLVMEKMGLNTPMQSQLQ